MTKGAAMPEDTTPRPTEAATREQIYDAEISPLIVKIIAICKREHLPMFATFFLDETEEDGVLKCTTMLDHGAELTGPVTRDDIANCHAVVSRGARVKTQLDATVIAVWKQGASS